MEYDVEYDAQDGIDYLESVSAVPGSIGELLGRMMSTDTPVTFLVPMPDSMDQVDRVVAAELAARRRSVQAVRVEAEVTRKLAEIERLGTDAMEDGTVVKFSKRLKPGGHAFTYAAVRINGLWYTTGPTGRKVTNDEFCAWLVSGEPDSLVSFNEMVAKAP